MTDLESSEPPLSSTCSRRQLLSGLSLLIVGGCQASPRGALSATSTSAVAPGRARAGSAPGPTTTPTAAVNSSETAEPLNSTPGNSAPEAATPTPSAAPARPPAIALLPLGEQLREEAVSLVQTALRAFYACEVQLLPRVALPQSAYTKARKRYRAEQLLTVLADSMPEGATRILGITAVDISTTKGKVADWGVLGLATIDGSACVISSFRTHRGAKNADHAAQRFAKTAVHEIGHTFGLEHCPSLGCLMADGQGTVFTTDSEYELCPQCRTRLAKAGVPLTDSNTAPPWPRV